MMFPAPDSSYKKTDFPENLIWIPRNLNVLNSASDIDEDSIPSIIITNQRCPWWLVYSHGNGCDVGHMLPDLYNYYSDFEVNILAFEYQGYGISQGSPTADHCKSDHLIVVDFLTKILQIPPKNLIFWGRSIGSGIASYACRKTENKFKSSIGGLILQSPYINIREMAKELVGKIGVLAPNALDNAANLKRIRSPVLFIHGEKDDLIPSWMSENLYSMAVSKQKTLKLCPLADHNSWFYEEDVRDPILRFLKEFTFLPELVEKVYKVDVEIPRKMFKPPINEKKS